MLHPFETHVPVVHATAWIAPTATIVGDVEIAADVSIWFGAVVRGDVEAIRVGPRSNLQDGVTVHVTTARHATVIGADVTVGHGAIVHGCTVGDSCLIGMAAVVMDGAEIGAESLVGAGALIVPGTRVPPRSLVLGTPATRVRALSPDEVREIAASAERYVALAGRYRAQGIGAAR
jgi:carbonic anhydrase/acetyltransferase-like protein (isoleucine patch superfamily)